MTDKVKLNIAISLNEALIDSHLKNASMAADCILRYGVQHQSLDTVEYWYNTLTVELLKVKDLIAAAEKMRNTLALKVEEDMSSYERQITTFRDENHALRKDYAVCVAENSIVHKEYIELPTPRIIPADAPNPWLDINDIRDRGLLSVWIKHSNDNYDPIEYECELVFGIYDMNQLLNYLKNGFELYEHYPQT